jgi:hypothetical protein
MAGHVLVLGSRLAFARNIGAFCEIPTICALSPGLLSPTVVTGIVHGFTVKNPRRVCTMVQTVAEGRLLAAR